MRTGRRDPLTSRRSRSRAAAGVASFAAVAGLGENTAACGAGCSATGWCRWTKAHWAPPRPCTIWALPAERTWTGCSDPPGPAQPARRLRPASSMAGPLKPDRRTVAIRPVALPRDRIGLLALDTSFVTDRIYAVQATAASFTLVEQAVAPPIRKGFPAGGRTGRRSAVAAGLRGRDWRCAGRLCRPALRAWNRRAAIWHLMWRRHGGRGIGGVVGNRRRISPARPVPHTWLGRAM